MKHISLPKKFSVEDIIPGSHAKVIIEPCFPGYGMTLGNTLRRVLLSSLAGGAVTAVKIKGVQHEFSSLADVSDDILEIILNLKQLRIRMFTDEPVTLKLQAKGEGKVTAAAIESSSDAEVVNTDLLITTINDDKRELDMELTVQKGIGYVPTEEQGKGKGEIGLILTDAIFTPIINVGLSVEATRVGQKTDYDKLVLDILTDGSIAPADAVQKAAEILTNQFTWIMAGGGNNDLEEVDVEAPVAEVEAPMTIDEAEEIIEKAESATETDGEAESEADDKPKKRGRPKKNDE
ncbi:MAG: DNA-directed RNA polymerase subunit alpha [Candidatus Buchananbacteria bacterium]|nr:DNA-directed RNA polymerase subunit alpha [Candidatus Buchananbacteria bacterium]